MALVLIGIGLFLVVFGLGYAFFIQNELRPEPPNLPRDVAGLAIDRRISGSDALAELAWMHGQDFQLEEAVVGIYGEEGEITIYVAGVDKNSIAEGLVHDMRDKIAAVDSPFEPVAERVIEQRTLYELDGLGQKHFYFDSGKLIIWLAVDAGLAEDALEQVLRFYPYKIHR